MSSIIPDGFCSYNDLVLSKLCESIFLLMHRVNLRGGLEGVNRASRSWKDVESLCYLHERSV